MAAALAQVKRDLGRGAVILRTRTVKTGGWLGLGAKTLVEITAGQDTNSLPVRSPAPRINPAGEGGASVAKGSAMHSPSPVLRDQPHPAAVHQELQDIKSLVQDLVRQTTQDRLADLPDELRQAYIRLIQNEVAEELAAEFIRALHSRLNDPHTLDPAVINEFLTQQLSRLIAPGCAIQLNPSADKPRVVALVGATGVGKTTTVAKLAAHFRLREGRKVGLITIDTYRIAAVDQLRTYARIIDIPLEVVLTPRQLSEALSRLAECDIVFIDTAGRSQFDVLKLNELKDFLEAARPHETHLVLSAGSSRAVLMQTIDRFTGVGVNRVIFTKLDEAVAVGTLLSVMQKMDARLSYITTGQDVPDDIELGDGRRLAQMILEANPDRPGSSRPGPSEEPTPQSAIRNPHCSLNSSSPAFNITM